MVKGRQGFFIPRVDEQAIDVRDEVVPGRAVDGKTAGEALVVVEDLFNHDVGVRRCLADPVKIGDRIDQPIDVVHAQACQLTSMRQVEDHSVALLQHFIHLDPEADQAVDGEETPVVDLSLSSAPVSKPVVLSL